MTPTRSEDAHSARERAATLLMQASALSALSKEDALRVVGYMQPHRARAGAVLLQADAADENHSMSLVVSGEVTVETVGHGDGLVVSVLGPGSLIGEMGLIDRGARSATCTAATDLALAVLTRQALQRMIEQEPAVAARLLLVMSKHIADHLREANRKLHALTSVGAALQQELDAVHSVNRRLLDQLDAMQSAAAKLA